MLLTTAAKLNRAEGIFRFLKGTGCWAIACSFPLNGVRHQHLDLSKRGRRIFACCCWCRCLVSSKISKNLIVIEVRLWIHFFMNSNNYRGSAIPEREWSSPSAPGCLIGRLIIRKARSDSWKVLITVNRYFGSSSATNCPLRIFGKGISFCYLWLSYLSTDERHGWRSLPILCNTGTIEFFRAHHHWKNSSWVRTASSPMEIGAIFETWFWKRRVPIKASLKKTIMWLWV